MNWRRYLIPLSVFGTILAVGTSVIILLLASHTSREVLPASAIWSFGFVFFSLQMCAPIAQLTSGVGRGPSKLREQFIWYGYLSLGVMSTLFFMSLIAELVYWLLLSSAILQDSELLNLCWILLCLGGSLLLVVIGLYQAHRPRVKSVSIPIIKLPREFDGLRIVQISDLHVSALIGRRFVSRVVQTANSLKPDLVVLTGDFVDGAVDALRYRMAPLKELVAPLGRYFITGNHEYYHNAEAWIAEHRSLGSMVLLNSHSEVSKAGQKLAIIGLTDRSGGAFVENHRPDLRRAVAGISPETIKILLAHQPNGFEEAFQAGIHLQISGHTHGGQFFPWQFAVKLVHKYSKGLYNHKGMWIYVSPGTGFWGPPLRTLVPSEITLLTLKTQDR